MRLGICLIFCIVGMAIFAIPNMTRRGVLFGLAVPADFRQSAAARRSIASFRVWTALALLAALSALFLLPDAFLGSVSMAGPLLILVAGGIGFLQEHRKLAPFAVEPTPQRQADLTNAPEHLPWFAWLAPGPFAVLLAAAVYLYLNWASIPMRFPVHWGFDGQPDRWNARTTRGVYGPIVFGAELCAWILISALATWFGARRSRFRRVTLAALIASEYVIGLLFAAMSTATLTHVPVWLIAVVPLFVFVPMIVMMARAIADPVDAAEPTPNECWKGGMIYYNPNDAALFVEKRAGLGYTFNFANRWSWALAFGLAVLLSTVPLLM